MKLSNISVDKITQFGIIKPELHQLFNKLGYYYHWFVISIKVKMGGLHNKTKPNLLESL